MVHWEAQGYRFELWQRWALPYVRNCGIPFFRPFAIILPKARFSHFEDMCGVMIAQDKVRNKKKPRNPAVTGLFFGPSDWNRTSGLLNPILSPRLFVAKNKEIIQLFRAFAIFRIVFISYFPYIPLAFRLYSASVAGEERVTTRPILVLQIRMPAEDPLTPPQQ